MTKHLQSDLPSWDLQNLIYLMGDNCVRPFHIDFFFQAEDGIRDAQESRGLGDVYKRQFKYSTTVKTVSKITVKPNKHFIKLKIFQIKFINNVVSHVFNN